MRWLVIALASAVALGCDLGGGSDDNDSGGGGGGGEDIVLLPSYAYELTSVTTDPVTVVVPLPPGDQTFVVRHVASGPGIFGVYDVETGTVTIEEGSSLAVEQPFGPAVPWPYFYNFTVTVTDTWRIPADGPPEQGALVAAREVMAGFEHVYVEVTADGLLQLSLDQTNDGTIDESVVYSFEELDDVFDGDGGWDEFGVFAMEVTGSLTTELMAYGIASFNLVVPELENNSPVTEACDAISDLGLSVPPPPPDIPDAGQLTFTWLDDAANGEVGPGDSFEADFTYCLENDPTNDIDPMLDGMLGFYSYTEVVEAGTNVLTRIGYEGVSPSGRPGGMVFDSVELWEIFDADGSGAGTIAGAERVARIDGRMTLVFFEPVN